MWTALARFEAAARRPWFGHALWLAICVGIVALSLLLSPSTEAVSLFGFDVPTLCTFRRLTGMGCPGCGLTRSFVFLAHGQLAEAFRLNPLGPVLFGVVLIQIPWQILRLYRSR
jgi:hypothetical protein